MGETDAVTQAVIDLQAAGWKITDGDGFSVVLAHPSHELEIAIHFNED